MTSPKKQQPTLKECKELLWEASDIGMDCYVPGRHLLSNEQIRAEYDRIAPLYPEYKAQYEAERAEAIRSADEFLAPYRETRAVSHESWSAWFSMAVCGGELKDVLRLYETQPKGGFKAWKQCHRVPDWLEPAIERWEKWKAEREGVPYSIFAKRYGKYVREAAS